MKVLKNKRRQGVRDSRLNESRRKKWKKEDREEEKIKKQNPKVWKMEDTKNAMKN